MKYKYVAYVLLLTLTSTLTQAQVKIGNNPTTITAGALLDIEGSTTTTRTVSLSNGNFGIGTNAPVNSLDVNGIIRSFSGSASNGAVTMNPGNSTGAGFIRWLKPGGASLALMGLTNTTSADMILSAESGGARLGINNWYGVGINTVTPAYPLDVNGIVRSFSGSDGNGAILLNPGNGSGAGFIRWLKPGGTSLALMGASGSTVNDMILNAEAGGARLGISGWYGVGIGTNEPTNPLHISGTNPLRLVGLNSGVETDNLLSVENSTGVVRSAPASVIKQIIGTSGSAQLIRTGNQAIAPGNQGGSLIQWNGVTINDEGGADLTNSGFRAIKAGTYILGVTTSVFTPGSGLGNTAIVITKSTGSTLSTIQRIQFDTSGGAVSTQNTTVVIPLQVGDFIRAYVTPCIGCPTGDSGYILGSATLSAIRSF